MSGHSTTTEFGAYPTRPSSYSGTWPRRPGTHATWDEAVDLEDLLVSLADKAWKATRVPELERLVVARLAATSAQEPWEVFMAMDDHLTDLAAGANARLAFQATHQPTSAQPEVGNQPSGWKWVGCVRRRRWGCRWVPRAYAIHKPAAR